MSEPSAHPEPTDEERDFDRVVCLHDEQDGPKLGEMDPAVVRICHAWFVLGHRAARGVL